MTLILGSTRGWRCFARAAADLDVYILRFGKKVQPAGVGHGGLRPQRLDHHGNIPACTW